ncbi:MAG: GNAT family N-acetyltransferase [Actinomycetota bacterium]
MELIARRLEPEEWPEAARVMARSLLESMAATFPISAVDRIVLLYDRYEGLPTDGGVATGVFGERHLLGAARAVPHPLCMCRSELPADAQQATRDYQAFRLANHPNRPHWFVGPVGVEPGLQRAGIGTLAMQELMRLVTGAGLVFLEAEDHNVVFYERVGFRPTLRTAAPDGVQLTFLEAHV